MRLSETQRETERHREGSSTERNRITDRGVFVCVCVLGGKRGSEESDMLATRQSSRNVFKKSVSDRVDIVKNILQVDIN